MLFVVKGQILHLLGLIARYHPYIMSEANIKQYLRWGISTLNAQLFKEQNADTNLVTGAIRGLHNYLFKFNDIMLQSMIFIWRMDLWVEEIQMLIDNILKIRTT